MKPTGLIVFILLAGLLGCDDEPMQPIEEPLYVPALTTPENVLYHLQVAYRRREPDRYAGLLHPEFRFWFQPGDARELGLEWWDLAQDTTATAALFRAEEVARIGVDLTHEPAVPVSGGPDTMFIRVNWTFLEVDEHDLGVQTVTWRVSGDIQDMWFVRGEGADSTRWYLLDWKDRAGGGGLLSLAARSSSWGSIKTMYR